ncbi:ABC transporter substrate-binding protein [Tropicimonas sp. IMCC34011]|uniref:ABC transporter substrate-binding protein n=1 Tax=Tropicimonas sp. IMCC34011 TaxID=2248759 RepID=UPI000E22A394|nr:ABC transporter substrate-binding protein [Tropicimonas sp. IMCC34011]
MKTFVATALGAAMVTTALAGPAMAQTIRVHQDADIRSTDPGVNRDGNTDDVILHVVEGLVGYDKEGRPQPLLAESIDVSDDGLEYTFHLRDDVRFHNGEPLTAEDVIFSWDRFMDPETGWRCLSSFDGRINLKVEDASAIDDMTVRFRLAAPNPLFLSSLARKDCGMTAITHRDSLNEDGTWNKPIGTGPFKLNEWRHREYISLVKNEDYANRGEEPNAYVGSKRPLVDELRFVVISDPATANAALVSGSIDIITRVPYAEVETLEAHDNIGITISPQLSPATLPLQTTDPLLSNVKMRQAIASAIDYDQLVAGVTYGLAEPNTSLVPISSPFYSDVTRQGFTYDPARTATLLEEAGYNGETLVLTTNKRNMPNFDAAVIAQAMLQAAGINVEVEVVEWGVQSSQWQAGNYQLMSFSYSARMDPVFSYEAVMGPKDEQPRKVWDDPESQEILIQAMNEPDEEKRQALIEDLHRRMVEFVPIIPLFNILSTGAYRDTITGYESSSFGGPQLWEVSKAE